MHRSTVQPFLFQMEVNLLSLGRQRLEGREKNEPQIHHPQVPVDGGEQCF